MIYIFDVDNTLVPSSQSMTDEMKFVFKEFTKNTPYYFTSGADEPKMRRQLTDDILDNAAGFYPVIGGEFWQDGIMKYQHKFIWPNGLKKHLEQAIEQSKYPVRTGKHIQDRITMVCVSTVGKAANLEERARYAEFDTKTSERKNLCADLQKKFPNLTCTVSGQTSIDISPLGCDKRQVLSHIRSGGYKGGITFFGDKIFSGGNDWPLAEAIRADGHPQSEVISVQNWQETFSIILSRINKAA